MQTRTAVRPRAAADGGKRAPRAAALVINMVLLLVAPGPRPAPAALGGAWTATGTPAVGACQNAYFPVALSLRREYRTSYARAQTHPVTHVETFRAISAESFTQRLEFTDGVPPVEQVWRCGAGGLISSQHGTTGSSRGHGTIETVKSAGVTIPAEDRWSVGSRWQSRHELRAARVVTAAADGRTGGTDGTITIASEIVAREPVSTPAGTFNAFRVRFTVDQNIITTRGRRRYPMQQSFRGVSWYAKDIGLVKSVIEKLTTTELISLAR